MNLGERFNPQRNCIGGLRLLFALTVVVSHVGPLSGYWWNIGRADNNLGTVAVEGFFVLSGVLVTRSAMKSESVGEFMLRRVVRILPGYWTALVVTSGVLAVLAALAGGGHLTLNDQIGYLGHNWALTSQQDGIGSTLAHNPYAATWNVPIWTLAWELWCYAVVGVLLALRALRPTVLLLFTVFAWSWLVLVPHADSRPSRFVLMFGLGATLWVFRGVVPVTRPLVAAAAATAAVTYSLGGFTEVGLLCFGYAVVAVATVPVWTSIGMRSDLSYGVYLYGWPLGQMLTTAGVGSAGWLVYGTTDVALALSFAALSWRFVERPAQKAARRISQPSRFISNEQRTDAADLVLPAVW